ncbi:mercury(II) reductase [Terrilactibacillus sp. BCM23-1]|uniref:Mercuric reductase n=1 Tax=Terrilactibacillus tamarindi TaxID=2599694 RepID=A0A6N8CTI4_9BACI|nr:mercury(II) reductase [Terrilactibacillus tamarindi]MTT33060.1 mercury(II) reductase [Terrilactibacillus tamarindi]
MITYRMTVQGMTCAGCEDHVASTLEHIGARNIKVNYQRGEALFGLPVSIKKETVERAIVEAHYQPVNFMQIQSEGDSDKEDDYDYIIIGSGGAAFASAIKAREYGARVAMIERGIVGGTCVNIGCVPSKTLLRAGEINNQAKNHPFKGLHTSAAEADLAQLVEQKNELVETLRIQKYENLIGTYGFELIKGEAKFVNEKTIEVNGRQLTGKRFLIATGASPLIPDIPGLNHVDFLTSTTLLELKKISKRLAVIGSGYVGFELGQLFHHLGTEVTLMQQSNQLLKKYDPEISETITRALTQQGIHFITGIKFKRIEQDGQIKKVHIKTEGKEQVIEAEQLLVATGRKPNTANLNLYSANVKVGTRGEVLIDEFSRTTNPRIYAAGDVTLGPQFVYVAAYQGGLAADNAVGGLGQKTDLDFVPSVMFTTPSTAMVGLTEEQAIKKGLKVKTSVLPLSTVPRAIVNRETTGVFKLVAEAKTLKVLGVHIVAENAGDVIYAATLAVKFGMTVEDLQDTLTPYLTMAEGLRLAALTFDKDISTLSCCAG